MVMLAAMADSRTRLGLHRALGRREVRPQDIENELVPRGDRIRRQRLAHELDRVEPVVADDAGTVHQRTNEVPIAVELQRAGAVQLKKKRSMASERLTRLSR